VTERNDPEAAGEPVDVESSGDPALDARLAEGILKGHAGLETAQVLMAAFLIAVSAFLAFSTVFSAPFSFEAARLVVQNAPLHHVATVAAGIAEAPSHPLGMLALAKNWWIAPNNPTAFHIVDFLLHVAVGMLLFGIARLLLGSRRQMAEPVAMLAGLLFVLHPLTTETVADVAARPILLSTFFMLVSVFAYLRSRREGGSALSVVVAVSSFVLGMTAHPVALALPLVVTALEWTAPPSRARRMAPFWVVAAFYLAVWWGAAGRLPVEPLSEGAWEWGSAGYLLKRMLFPVGLSIYPVAEGAAAGWLALGGLVGVVTAAAAALIRRSPAAVALIWWGAMLTAALWFAPAGLRERLAYPSLAGACLLMPWAFEFMRRPGARAATGISAAILLILLGVTTFVRANAWVDPVRLWSGAVEMAPEAATPRERLGLLYLNRAEAVAGSEIERRDAVVEAARASAFTHLTRAVELGASSAAVYEGLGRAYAFRDETAASLGAFQQALRLEPGDARLLASTGEASARVAFETDDRRGLVQALRYLTAAQAAGPLAPEYLVALGSVQAALGRFEEAASTLEEVSDAGEAPAKDIAQLNQVGEAAKELQQRAEAARERDYLQALVLESQLAALRNRPLQALYMAAYVYKQQPGNWQAWVSLGASKAQLGEIDGFLARELPPPATPEGVPPAWRMLALKAAFSGEWEAAGKVVAAAGQEANTALVLGELALELGQIDRAQDYLREAARLAPQDYRPWLRLAEGALAGGNKAQAGGYVQEAERRGAPADAVRGLRSQGAVGGGDAVPMMQ
jgi:tetratricopeptide (TPR) repeat protein